MGSVLSYCFAQMLACERGHGDVVETLLNWRPTAILVSNKHGELPAQAARRRGHGSVLQLLARFAKTVDDTALTAAAAGTDVTQAGGETVNLLSDDYVFKKPQVPRHSTPRSERQCPDCAGAPCRQERTPHGGSNRRKRLLKRISVEVLPDYPSAATAARVEARVPPLSQERARSLTLEEMNSSLAARHAYDATQLQLGADPMMSVYGRDLDSPPLMFVSDASGLTLHDLHQQHSAMETGEAIVRALVPPRQVRLSSVHWYHRDRRGSRPCPTLWGQIMLLSWHVYHEDS